MLSRLLSFFLTAMATAPGLAQTVHLTKIEGGVWYGATREAITQPLVNRAEVGPGFLQTGSDGSLYGSTGPGSKFRIGPSTELEIQGMRHALPCGIQDALALALTRGKLTAFDVPGAKGYEVHLPGGRVCMASTLCVLCMHGAAAHVYVARGEVEIFPGQGQYHLNGLKMMARPTVAVLDSNGALKLEPLINAAPGTANCLLSGASPEVAAAVQEGSPNPSNTPGNPPVSETQ